MWTIIHLLSHEQKGKVAKVYLTMVGFLSDELNSPAANGSSAPGMREISSDLHGVHEDM